LAPDKNALKDVIVNKDKPVVCKPNDEGSSVGTFIFKNIDDILLPKWGFGPVLIESYIPGQEISVPVMDDRALGVLELKPMEGFYDYTAKYQEGKTDHIYPARLPTAVTQQAHEWAVKAHDVLGCEGVSRTDFRYNPEEGEEGLYVLEVNTQPGLTSLSIVPEVAAYEGISFAQLLIWMIENARKPRQ
jgi:D-alanine-D-alanine ligase